MSSFNSFLLDIGEEIESSELNTMKILCSDYGIGAQRLEQISNAMDLFKELKKRDLLGPENKDLLVTLLEKAGRIDLKNKVLGVQGSTGAETSSNSHSVPDGPVVSNQIVKDTHLNDISEDLGRDWKMLGRKLEISGGILDNIDVENRRVKDKSFEMMSRWKKQRGNNATGQALANALVAIGRRDVAETLAGLCQPDGIDIHIGTQSSSSHTNSRTESGGLNTMQADLGPRLPTQESRPQ